MRRRGLPGQISWLSQRQDAPLAYDASPLPPPALYPLGAEADGLLGAEMIRSQNTCSEGFSWVRYSRTKPPSCNVPHTIVRLMVT